MPRLNLTRRKEDEEGDDREHEQHEPEHEHEHEPEHEHSNKTQHSDDLQQPKPLQKRQIKTVAELAGRESTSSGFKIRPTTRDSDSKANASSAQIKIWTPDSEISSSRIRRIGSVPEKTFSLVNPTSRKISRVTTISASTSSSSLTALASASAHASTSASSTGRQNTCIVCLKINKSLFNQIFQVGDTNKNIDGKTTTSFGSKSKLHGKRLDTSSPDESISNMSVEMQMELSQDKTLDIPDIYGITELDVRPERIQFKQYSDIDEECLNQKLNSHGLSDKKIHLILTNFKNKSWPDSSPYACWNCTECFDNSPVGIPTIAMAESYEDKYYLEGNFCSFNCAGRYLFDTRSRADNELWTIYEIMNFIYNEVNGSEEYEKIKLAPERICLKKFGGHLTLEEYRKNYLSKINYEVFRSPLIPALYHIQENVDLSRLIKAAKKK